MVKWTTKFMNQFHNSIFLGWTMALRLERSVNVWPTCSWKIASIYSLAKLSENKIPCIQTLILTSPSDSEFRSSTLRKSESCFCDDKNHRISGTVFLLLSFSNLFLSLASVAGQTAGYRAGPVAIEQIVAITEEVDIDTTACYKGHWYDITKIIH